MMATRWDEATEKPTTGGAKAGAQVSPPATRMDPYAQWAIATKWRGMTGDAGWDRIPADDRLVQILARAEDDSALDDFLPTNGQYAALVSIPNTYQAVIVGSAKRARHFTAWVRCQDIEAFAAAASRLRWELSQPRRSAERFALGSPSGRFGPTRDTLNFAATNVLAAEIAAVAYAEKEEPLERAIAVIDFGCPFLNRVFAKTPDCPATRVARLWDQGGAKLTVGDTRAGPSWPWTTPLSTGYGREIRSNALQAMAQRVHTATSPATPAIDERTAYRGIDYLIDYDDPRRRVWYATHGAHVLDMAGGSTDPLTGSTDAASSAPLVFVQLPSMTAADSSGASLASHVLDAVRYVLDQCRPKAPIVINLSYGSFAGPHDGNALIETALDELLQARGLNFAVVLAAGNSRESQCHVTRTLEPERSALLRCAIAPRDSTDSFVEAWFPAPPQGWVVEARVLSPDRLWSGSVRPDEQVLQRDIAMGGEVTAMLRYDTDPPNGRAKHLVLLALAPTAAPANIATALAEAGTWEIELSLVRLPYVDTAAVSLQVQAWIERDDPGQLPGAAPHQFLDLGVDDDLDTLNSLATGESTVVVGGFRLSNRHMTAYSSVGPQRNPLSDVPFVLAGCEEDDVNPNLNATAVRSGETYRMNGTSVAAPVLARRLFNAMAASRTRIGRAGWRRIILGLAAAPGAPVEVPRE